MPLTSIFIDNMINDAIGFIANSKVNSAANLIDPAVNSVETLGISKDTPALLVSLVTPFLLKAIAALAVFVIGLWIAGRVKKLVAATFSRSDRFDETLESFLSSLIWYGLVALVAITTLGVFGVPTTSFAALIGAAGLAIGLALQGTLGHIASGVMLLSFRPFEINDYIEAAGHAGTVKKLTLFTTELATSDNKQIIIPNGEVWSKSIVNYSAYGERRLDLVFGVSYNDNLDDTMGIIKEIIEGEERILAHKETAIALDTLGDHTVNIICRPWVKSSDYTAVKWTLTKQIKERFDAEGITIPFPTRTIISTS